MQSYRHADPRRRQQHGRIVIAACVTSNRATVTVFVTVWPWLCVNACWATAIEYVYPVPSLVLIAQAVFLLERGQTDRQTRLTAGEGNYTPEIFVADVICLVCYSWYICDACWAYNPRLTGVYNVALWLLWSYLGLNLPQGESQQHLGSPLAIDIQLRLCSARQV